jgi:D-aminoacyl-tRNA deacylase
MISVVQRVTEAGVEIETQIYSQIGKGLMVLVGVRKGDTEESSVSMAKKLIDLRIFSDENDKMNLNVRDIGGEVLIISQFTLCSDNGKSGNRPSFAFAEAPARANLLYELLISEMKSYYIPEKIKSGVFAAKMKVNLINDGPVTIILEKN